MIIKSQVLTAGIPDHFSKPLIFYRIIVFPCRNNLLQELSWVTAAFDRLRQRINPVFCFLHLHGKTPCGAGKLGQRNNPVAEPVEAPV